MEHLDAYGIHIPLEISEVPYVSPVDVDGGSTPVSGVNACGLSTISLHPPMVVDDGLSRYSIRSLANGHHLNSFMNIRGDRSAKRGKTLLVANYKFISVNKRQNTMNGC